jgi:purine-binding chemotaxis protein CheW
VKRSRTVARGPTDWARVRDRLARAQAATEASLGESPERSREILEERARALARAPAASETGEVLEMIAFGLGAERYLLEAKYAREVARLVDFTPVPGAADFVVGVTNLRGDVVCVIDLRKFFNLADRALTDLSRVIAIGAETTEFGILADQVFDVSVLSTKDILPAPQAVAGVGREYLLGVMCDASIVLDGAVLLHDPRLYVEHGEERGA